MTEIVIRPARPEDAAALGALGRQTFIDTFVTGFGIPYPADDLTAFLDASFSPETIRTKLKEPGSAWWVAEAANGDLLAFANTGPNTLPHPDARPSHAFPSAVVQACDFGLGPETPPLVAARTGGAGARSGG